MCRDVTESKLHISISNVSVPFERSRSPLSHVSQETCRYASGCTPSQLQCSDWMQLVREGTDDNVISMTTYLLHIFTGKLKK
jgi:hypothetical protein